MLRKKIAMMYLFLLVTLIFVQLGFAGTTGKIAGTVIDKTSGDPLQGANVIVVGTSLGAATDHEGQYSILYVPPGVYSVQVFVMGYMNVTIEDVPVHIDQTARINFELEVEAIRGETITVVAERKTIRVDVATSVVSVSEQEVEALPVSNVDEIISLQAGIRDDMAIRGGEAEDVLFVVDGVAMRDPRNNEPITKVPLSAVKEISVERGGFNAEYGQVQSGIVNVVTKEGGVKGYHGSFQYKYTPPAPKYYRGNGIPDVHDPDSYWMRPFLDDAVCWTGTNNGEPFTDANANGVWDDGESYTDLNGDGSRSYWNQYIRDQYLTFVGWNEISRQLLSDADPDNDLTPQGAQRVFLYETRKSQPNNIPDYDIDAGFGGPVPLVSEMLGNLRFFTSYRKHRDVLLFPQARPDYSDYDWSTQLTSDIGDGMKLRITALMGNVATMAENWNYGVYPHWPKDIASGTGGMALFNVFSDWAWCLSDIKHRSLAVKFTHALSPNTLYEVTLENFRRSYNTEPAALRDTTKNAEILPGYWVDEYPLGYWPYEVVGVTSDIKDGIQASLARDYSTSQSTSLKADLTSQINFNNLVKAGAEFVYNDLDLDYGFIQMQTQGKSYASHVQMHNFPVRAALYIQDKMETEGFTMNAGLRLDYSNSRTDWWDIMTNSYNPYFVSSKYSEDRSFEMEKSKSQWQLSPRLGISHPITENSKLFFNYGHFKQIPQYETLFRVQRSSTGTLGAIGDPNLILAKTISYELGYDHVLFNSFLFQMAAFYKDISDQQNETQYQTINRDQYDLITSNGYKDIRGLELTLRKTTGRWISGFMNYTYQVSSDGHFGREEVYQDPSRQKDYDEATTNQYQERPIPTPYARANLALHTPDDFGPAVFGHCVLGGFRLNLLLNWDKGGWTTFNPKNASGITNNVGYVDKWDGTLRASKAITGKKFRIQFMMDVTNLFNRLELRDTDNQQYRLSLHLPESDAYDNLEGNDKLGDYRKPGVEWQPIEYRMKIAGTTAPDNDFPIYLEGNTNSYWEIVDGSWVPVDGMQLWEKIDGEWVNIDPMPVDDLLEYDTDGNLLHSYKWTIESDSRMDKVLDDKAYIFNPGPSTWWFLNPRTVIFGVRLSFDLD